ncbi:MAG TPA: SDR family oxidoreductase [Magnetospirillaceae bacterium]|jgi:NAD(P)-dependent dehydrogenase (short-subunit alcohol dehydrogenase family)
MKLANYPSLKDRVVFITGGGSGIGASMVQAFAEQGARVAFIDIAVEASDALIQSLSHVAHRPWFLRCDLLDIPSLQAAMARVEQEVGPIAVLVNNAANDDRHNIDDVTVEYWDRSMGVNLRHQFFAAQAARKQMRKLGHGAIINFSSIAWMAGGQRMAIYSSAKAAVVGLTHSLANEFGSENIRVNAIAPGAVITERQRKLWLNDDDIAAIVKRQGIKRVLVAEDIARVALFLAADDSGMVTKQCLTVDAGLR